jgi:regulator of protease activity HflC (stomatin/prohibitin superfamily)
VLIDQGTRENQLLCVAVDNLFQCSLSDNLAERSKVSTEKENIMRTIYGTIYTLRPYERGIQEFLGKYNRFVMPGIGFQFPFIHVTRVRDIREHTMDIEPQPVITKDNVEITVDGVMWVRPTGNEESIKRTFYNIDDWKRAVIQLAMTNLRQEFGELSLDESLVAREKIANNLQRILNTFAVEWGLTVSKVEIRLMISREPCISRRLPSKSGVL